MIDKDISEDPFYFTASYNDIVYDNEPPQSMFYVNFTYDTTDAVYVSYLRSNLNWKTRYQLNLFEEPKSPVLIAMADIHNDGQSKIDIDHAELLGGDINLQSNGFQNNPTMYYRAESAFMDRAGSPTTTQGSVPKLARGEEVAGLYMFAVNQPFSIDARSNYALPMFRPRVTVDRFSLISKSFYGGAVSSSGKATRAYRLISDRFLSRGNCIIRESDQLAGETLLPDLAARDKHEFSIGQDADITYKENATLISTRSYSNSIRPSAVNIQTRTLSIYEVVTIVKNFKKNRRVKIEYSQQVIGQSVKLIVPNAVFSQDGSNIKCAVTVGADEEKVLSYRVEVIN
jgi:hypothetical protein